ncbi:hypothetical protein F4824DRAFT_498671 [Ustulina deusta]|nr:hypothetical protein F4824DRAFT_498671 [Ustulina deusta]
MSKNRTLSRTFVDGLHDNLQEIDDALKTTNISLGLRRSLNDVGHPPLSVPTEPESDNYYLPSSTSSSVPLDTFTALEQESTTTTVFQLVRKTPKEICANIPSCYHELHVEYALRGNLMQAFDETLKRARRGTI